MNKIEIGPVCAMYRVGPHAELVRGVSCAGMPSVYLPVEFADAIAALQRDSEALGVAVGALGWAEDVFRREGYRAACDHVATDLQHIREIQERGQ